MAGLMCVALGAAAFVGSHFALSHPLRAPLVRLLGLRGFMGLYTLVAFVTLGVMVWAYRIAHVTPPLWPVSDGLWGLVTVAMLLASMLLMGALVGNPALPDPTGHARIPEAARGVFAITRHPMMWAIALWGLCHIAVKPVSRNIIVAGAMIVLALGGAAMQDRKKAALDSVGWPLWESRTSFWPFAAMAQGKARVGSFGALALVGGVVLWLGATWAHGPVAAGIFRWIAL